MRKNHIDKMLKPNSRINPEAKVEGEVILDGVNIYSPKVDPVAIRRRIGMVFQKANPFPTMSIYDNAVAGLKLNGVRDKEEARAAGRKEPSDGVSLGRSQG